VAAPLDATWEAAPATIGDEARAPGDASIVSAAASPRASRTGANRTFRTPGATEPALPYGPADVVSSIDDYDLLGELGQGGMGVVYRAFARRLGRYVAVKLIRSGDQASDLEVARFLNEATLAARLSHPNIVRIYDARQTSEGASYFVMEMIAGGTLGQRLDAGLCDGDAPPTAASEESGVAAMTQRQAIEVLEKTARAVHYAHQHGVVHRDIKPDNILLDAEGEPHVTDFGIAKAFERAGADRTDLTAAGHIMGSPHYMSPEQANGEIAAIGPRSDVYSLGATLYHVLAGRTMFEGTTAMSIVLKVLSADAPRPSAVARSAGRPRVPLDLETICLKAIEKEAARRYGSALEFADELRRVLDGEPILARPVGALERARKKLRKNRKVLVATFLAASLVLTLGIAFALSLLDNVRRSSNSLKALDRAEALSQAATLERAIRVNMLQGRADLARELVHRLGKDKNAGTIRVLRQDKTPAYRDRKTRRQVEQRLARGDVLAQIKKDHPDLLDEIDELKRRAFPNIDKSDPVPARPMRVSARHFADALRSRKPVTYVEELPSRKRRLVVLKPIENSARCQACHGGADDYYDDNRVRAVLVVRRPQDQIERVIYNNRRSTLFIGSGTALVLLLLAIVYARVFGIGLGRRRFGE
jgi:serine/threonine protein kinase